MIAALLDWVANGARKATGAFAVALLGALGTAMLNGSLSGAEVVAALGTAAVAAAAVFELENSGKRAPDAPGQHRAE